MYMCMCFDMPGFPSVQCQTFTIISTTCTIHQMAAEHYVNDSMIHPMGFVLVNGGNV